MYKRSLQLYENHMFFSHLFLNNFYQDHCQSKDGKMLSTLESNYNLDQPSMILIVNLKNVTFLFDVD